MLSTLVSRCAEEKEESRRLSKQFIEVDLTDTMEADDMNKTPSAPPVYTPPNAPPNPATVSLNILTNAMSSTTGATNAQKEEKAAYASYAEAMKDDINIKIIKSRVNEQIIPRLEHELQSMQRRKKILYAVMLISAILALFTSGVTIIKDLKITLPNSGNATHIEMPAWVRDLSVFIGMLNFASMGVALGCAKMMDGMVRSIDQVRKEISKKKAYIDATRIAFRGSVDFSKLDTRDTERYAVTPEARGLLW
ncbi:NS3 [Warrego virus]|uniref:NS3 n=1 Tax=Warrego virus TaxID=40062 RepID=A0A097I4F1_9REOV|nr:NS3 [Warrego virus]AIT55722.1 NS3 [Warrego virus]